MVPAVATGVPHRHQQRCQAPALRHLAEPLAEAAAAFQGALRQRVRPHVGDVIRQEPRTEPGHAGGLTVPGLVPRPLTEPQAPGSPTPTPRVSPLAPEPAADAVVAQLLRHPRSLLTRTARPPVRVAGIETYERLDNGARCRLERLAQRYAPRLVQLSQGLHAALAPLAQTPPEWQQGAGGRRALADIFDPVPSRPIHAAHGAGPWRRYRDTVRRGPQATPT